jgi:hypothetical protein
MRRSLKMSKPFRNRTGQIGAVAEVEIEHGGYVTRYHVRTHGRSPEETASKIRGWEAHHEKKAKRLEKFRALSWTEIRVRSEVFVVTDLKIMERGDDVEFEAVAKHRIGQTLRSFPGGTIREFYGTIDEVPLDFAIIELLRLAAERWVDEGQRSAAYEQQVNAALSGVQGG